jgi:hypothetical protein
LFFFGRYAFDNNPKNNLTITDKSSSHKLKTISKDPLIEVTGDEAVAASAVDEEEATKLISYDDDWCLSSDLDPQSKDLASYEYEQWATARNHIGEDRAEQVNRYNDYQPETLKLLAEQGDLLALSAIVLNPNTDHKERNWAARMAAIYGGTGSAMSHFSTSLKGKSAIQMSTGKKIEAKKNFLESVAWDEFSVLRGDLLLLDVIPFTLSLDSMSEMKITKEDEKLISQRAKEIYAELTQERLSRGLGEFDNSIPRVVAIESVAVAAYNIKRNSGDHWYSKYFPTSRCVKRYLEGKRQ